VSFAGTFIDGGAGRIFLLTYEPAAPTGAALLVVPAFAEEMNKSRRLVAATARALAARGVRTVVPDLYGTGDSAGEFAAARWETWCEDLRRAADWLRERGAREIDVLLVRLGAALHADAFAGGAVPFRRAVAWQPVARGAETLRQLVRLKNMAARMAGEKTGSVEEMLRELTTGPEPMELGGYLVARELAASLERATFAPAAEGMPPHGLVVEFDPSAPAASAEPAGAAWRSVKIAGERFWSVVEPRDNLALVAATVQFLTAG
jgi:exosortase A-associated hydrolase 2